MRREGTVSANWRDTRAGVIIFCQEGHSGVLAEGRGLSRAVCTFSEAFDSGPNSLSCAKAGAMDGKCLLARLTRSSNRGCWGSARSFPSAGKFNFQSWSEGACQSIYFEVSACWNFWLKWGKSGDDAEPLTWLKE